MLPSTTVLARPAGPALLGPPAFESPPRDLPTEASLAQASAGAPTLATILFPDFLLHSPGTSDAEAPAAEPFKIDSIDKAAWAASKVLEAQARMAERAELATAYINKITSWLSASNKTDEDTVSYLSMLLRPFVESELSRTHSRSRTLQLLTASASLRKAPDRVSILMKRRPWHSWKSITQRP
ncbi:hypothetical protein MASR2M78_09750 [Treponema sp.]